MGEPEPIGPVQAPNETAKASETVLPDQPDNFPAPSPEEAPLPDPSASDPSLPAEELAPSSEHKQVEPEVECASPGETPTIPPAPPILAPIDVTDLDWPAIQARSLDPEQLRDAAGIVEALESCMDAPEGLDLLFDKDRSDRADRAIRIAVEQPVWFIGDLHGDLLALEAALAFIERETEPGGGKAGIVFLGDLFDDGGPALALLLRVYQLILEHPHRVCLIAGNHDEALGFENGQFTSSVDPSDFADYLNDNLSDASIARAGHLAIRLAERAPRALFFPDGLLAAHGGFPLVDLHERLRETGDCNDPQVLEDFVWTRAHPKARKKLPNRYSRGSQFGYEDFASFCALSAELGRPVSHMIRGHDHVDDRYAIYGRDRPNPILTIVALSRRLPRESTGSFARVPTMARFVSGALPQVYRLHIPPALIEAFYPQHQTDQTENKSS